MIHKGDWVVTTTTIRSAAFYAEKGKEGKTRVTIGEGQKLRAATDELGGNVWVRTRTGAGDSVLVPLAEGEWAEPDQE